MLTSFLKTPVDFIATRNNIVTQKETKQHILYWLYLTLLILQQTSKLNYIDTSKKHPARAVFLKNPATQIKFLKNVTIVNNHTIQQLNLTYLRHHIKNKRQKLQLQLQKYQRTKRSETNHKITIKYRHRPRRTPFFSRRWRLLKRTYKTTIQRNLRTLFLKKRNTATNTGEQNINKKHRFKKKLDRTTQTAPVRFAKNRITLYRTKRRGSIRKFKQAFSKWSTTAQESSKILTTFTKRPLPHKKILILTRLLRTFQRNKRSRSLLSRMKRFFHIRYKVFIKSRNSRILKVTNKASFAGRLYLSTANSKNNCIYNITSNTNTLLKNINQEERFKRKYLTYKTVKLQQTYLEHKSVKKVRSMLGSNTFNHTKKTILSRLFLTNKNSFYNMCNNATLYLSNLPEFNLRMFVNVPRFATTLFNNLYALKSVRDQNDTIQNSTLYLRTNFIKNSAFSAQPYVTNYTPLFFFDTKAQTLDNTSALVTQIKTQYYYSVITSHITMKYKNFFVFFLLNFLEKYTNRKIWLKISSRDPFTPFWKNYINTFCRTQSYTSRRSHKLLPMREILEILVLMFLTQDLQIFLMYIKRRFEQNHFKTHKRILSMLFEILRKNKALFSLTPIKGLSFDIRGKVGVSGNAKKRHVFFSYGKITTTSQNVRSYWQQISVWTPTGQMGITCLLQS